MIQIDRVGIRSLKAKLSQHLNAEKPIAVTKNGRTIGIYLPIAQDSDRELLTMLDRANDILQELQEKAEQ